MTWFTRHEFHTLLGVASFIREIKCWVASQHICLSFPPFLIYTGNCLLFNVYVIRSLSIQYILLFDFPFSFLCFSIVCPTYTFSLSNMHVSFHLTYVFFYQTSLVSNPFHVCLLNIRCLTFNYPISIFSFLFIYLFIYFFIFCWIFRIRSLDFRFECSSSKYVFPTLLIRYMYLIEHSFHCYPNV